MYLVSAPLYYSSLALINNRAILWRWDKGVKLNVGFAVQRDICYNHAHCEKLAQFVKKNLPIFDITVRSVKKLGDVCPNPVYQTRCFKLENWKNPVQIDKGSAGFLADNHTKVLSFTILKSKL